jgi:hypothetical protein
LTEYSPPDFIRTCSELVWSTQKPSIPLAFEGSPQNHTVSVSGKLKDDPVIQHLFDAAPEDAVGAWTMAIPFIDGKTYIYEYGCWNGGNLLGLLFFGLENGIHPGACMGTDINIGALNIAETLARTFSLHPPLVQFHLSNALYLNSIDIHRFKCQKQVKIALRLIPVLEPSDAEHFLVQAKNEMTRECYLILSYAIPKGEKYEGNKMLAASSKSSIREDSFGEGVIFRFPFDHPGILPQLVEFPNRIDQVINCYYTPEGFEKLAHRCGYRIVNAMTVGQYSDNFRAVVVLKIQ